ncbi:zinc-binding protein A33-like [Chanos chanos]|uniref:Zinc-binding protein A33-like n=1 Tax=Chanos chanos TaxID=29144 RepID=A0A6J2UM85_CHACN|nr:zinc-binding protein A33-like [Chanos chanos]
MTEPHSLIEEDLLCPVCCEVFSVPVILHCGHNFCKLCIQKYWDSKDSRQCPVCRATEITQRPPINLALKIASDSFRNETEKPSVTVEELCPTHNEKLKLFCRKDAKPICLICHTSREHKHHECSPVAEAASERKKQARQTEALIKEEFEKLHSFLRDEESARLTVLRVEESRKTQEAKEKLEDMNKKMAELTNIIRDIESIMKADDLMFLKPQASFTFQVGALSKDKGCCRSRYPMQEPQDPKGVLMDSAQYLCSLKYRVWKRMEGIVQHCPVTLDPNTAQPNLILSDEYTSVTYGKKQKVPDNPERCSSRMAVLGMDGFTSGKHSWNVDVGESKEWYIGLARESIKRKSTVFLNPSEGFWVIGLNNGETYWAQTSPRTRITLRQKPQKITVELDYEKGKVVFTNAVDGSPIYTFKDKFTEKMFPYFSPGITEEGTNPIKICPYKVSIMFY